MSNGGTVSLKPNDPSATDILRLMALNPDGPANILPPRAEFRLPVYVCVPSEQEVEVTLKSLGVLPEDGADDRVDWSKLFLPLPSGVTDPTREAAIDALEAERGTTWREYVERLGKTAAVIALEGEREYSVDELIPHLAGSAGASTTNKQDYDQIRL